MDKAKSNTNKGFTKVLHQLAQAKWFDLLGVLIVILIAWQSGYLNEHLNQIVQWGTWTKYVPFGLISVGSAIISIYSDRLTARLNNLGNWIGLFGVIVSGSIDYILGNHAAIYTYPITFIIQGWAIHTWMHSKQYETTKPLTGAKGILTIIGIFVAALMFSYSINRLGFPQTNWLFYVTTLVFALSLAANVLNALKLTLQWKFWSAYNVIQLIKAVIQGNYANVGKYIYYIIVSIAGLVFWNHSDDQ